MRAYVNNVVETRHEIWKAPLSSAEAVYRCSWSYLVREGREGFEDASETGGTLQLRHASDSGGTDGFVSVLAAALPVLQKTIPHHHRVVSRDYEEGPRDGDESREGFEKHHDFLLGI